MKSVRSGSRQAPERLGDSAGHRSSVARYGRVAMVEAVLSIRHRQQRVVRRVLVASLVLTGIAVIVVGVSGWF